MVCRLHFSNSSCLMRVLMPSPIFDGFSREIAVSADELDALADDLHGHVANVVFGAARSGRRRLNRNFFVFARRPGWIVGVGIVYFHRLAVEVRIGKEAG